MISTLCLLSLLGKYRIRTRGGSKSFDRFTVVLAPHPPRHAVFTSFLSFISFKAHRASLSDAFGSPFWLCNGRRKHSTDLVVWLLWLQFLQLNQTSKLQLTSLLNSILCSSVRRLLTEKIRTSRKSMGSEFRTSLR